MEISDQINKKERSIDGGRERERERETEHKAAAAAAADMYTTDL